MAGDFDEPKQTSNRVEFYMRPKHDPIATAKEGRPMVKMVEFIRISGGDRTNMPDKPVHDGHRRQYARQYAAFLANKSQDEAGGTLLSAWGGIAPERVEELKYFKIYTVEHLAGVADGRLQEMGLHTRKERDRARDYVATAKGQAPVMQLRAEVEAKESRIAELERRLNLMMEHAQTAPVAPEVIPPTKRKAKAEAAE